MASRTLTGESCSELRFTAKARNLPAVLTNS